MSIYFGGSRNLSKSHLLFQVVQACIIAENQIHVGCQFGADQQVITAAIFAPHGESFLSVFAVSPTLAQVPAHVREIAQGESNIILNAGGQSTPIPARYLLRSIAAFRGCSQAVFFSPGPGSLAVARECARSSLPVFAFGEMPAPIPSVGGQWVESSFMGFECWQWHSTITQIHLF